MSRWVWRIVTAVGLWGAAIGYGELTDRTPHLLPLAAAVAAILAVVWLCTDALEVSEPPQWTLYRSAAPERTFDPRFSRLSQELAEASDRRSASIAVHRSLTAIADRMLRDRYDVDRRREPDRQPATYSVSPRRRTSTAVPGTEKLVFSPLLFDVLDRLESL